VRFATFSTSQLPKPHLGIVQGDELLDADLAGQALNVNIPDQLQELIDHYAEFGSALQAISEKAAGRRFTEVKTYTDIGAAHKLSEVRLFAPIPYPRKNVMAVGLNYKAHAEETAAIRKRSGDAPSYPIFFTKATTSITGPYDNIVIDPAASTKLDWEVELGVVIGKRGKNISEGEALSYVFGYTVINDVSARDLQSNHVQYFKGKSLDTTCPIGPWIVTADELADPANLPLRLLVNGQVKQNSNTGDMIFPVPTLIASLSAGMTLEPGDILATGTPSGVGFSRKPPEFLKPGDTVEAIVEGIGALRNPVVGL